jgi:pterin-4a-carbinolamine dehydratase
VTFIPQNQRPMEFGDPPIEPAEAHLPVIPVERWRDVDGWLVKTYMFRRPNDRAVFVDGLLSYEQTQQHNAIITIFSNEVGLRLRTEGVERPTDLDKEYAKYADVLFRDIVFSVSQ